MSLSAKVSVKSRFKHAKREITTGIAHISSSFNNTKVAISDVQGNVIAWSSGGAVKFKGSKKSTPYAAQRASEEVAQKAQKMYGLKNIDVCVRGFGPGRDTAVRSLASSGLSVLSVKDVTPLAHGGCRPKKQRRV